MIGIKSESNFNDIRTEDNRTSVCYEPGIIGLVRVTEQKEKPVPNIAFAISWHLSTFGEQIFLTAFILQTNTFSQIRSSLSHSSAVHCRPSV